LPHPDPAWSTDQLNSVHQTPDKQRRVRDMFAAISRSYDFNNRLHSFGLDQSWRRKTVKLAQLKSADIVVDVACGTGDLSVMLGQHVASPVLGIDYTFEMLPIAQKKQGNAVYIHGDAMNLPLPDASVDVVTIAFGLRNVQDAPKALGEFRRVLRPGGRLLVLEFCEPTNPLIRLGNHLYTKRIMPWTATLISRDRSGAYLYLPKSVSSFYNQPQMLAAFSSAGFVKNKAHPMTFGTCVAYVGHVA
jgi:demethylmenaquinone methyltransferase / 2-methoxy-6-polyprenyl-1,4-benzoquinol methylase